MRHVRVVLELNYLRDCFHGGQRARVVLARLLQYLVVDGERRAFAVQARAHRRFISRHVFFPD